MGQNLIHTREEYVKNRQVSGGVVRRLIDKTKLAKIEGTIRTHGLGGDVMWYKYRSQSLFRTMIERKEACVCNLMYLKKHPYRAN